MGPSDIFPNSLLDPRFVYRDVLAFFQTNTAAPVWAFSLSWLNYVLTPWGFVSSPAAIRTETWTCMLSGIPAEWLNSSFSAQTYKLGMENEGMSGESQTRRRRGCLPVLLPLGTAARAAWERRFLLPRHLQLPASGCDIRLDDNYRGKCQPHSQEHCYPLAN